MHTQLWLIFDHTCVNHDIEFKRFSATSCLYIPTSTSQLGLNINRRLDGLTATKTRGNFWCRISTIHEHVRKFSKRGWLWPLSVSLDVTSPDVFDLSGRNSLDYWDASCVPTKSQRNCDSASPASFTMLIYSHLEKIYQRVKWVLISRVPHKIKKGVFCLVTVCGRENCPSSSMIYQMIGNGDVP